MQNRNNNYDFDLIISSEDLKANREKQLLKRRKRKLRTWVKVTLLLLAGAIIGITIYQFCTVETVQTTPVGNYTCRGGIIKVCTGSEAVADYLGV